MNHTVLVALITGLFAAVGGAGIWGFLSNWLKLGAAREESEIRRLREEVGQLRDSHRTCEAEVEGLKDRLHAVEHHHVSQLARWIKDASKRIVWLNARAHMTIFAPRGHAREACIGKTFAELLDPQAAAEIDRLDRIALAQPGVAASTLIQLHPDLPLMHIVKVAAEGRDGELIFEGYAYRANDRDMSDAEGAERQSEQRVASIDHMLQRFRDT